MVHTGIKPYKCIACEYVSYSESNVWHLHFAKSHGRKGTRSDMIVDIVERDRMVGMARADADQMIKSRKT